MMHLKINKFITKTYLIVAALICCLLLENCKPSAKQWAATKSDRPERAEEVKMPVDSPQTVDTSTDDDCPKGAATPVVKQALYPSAKFVLQPDRRTGVETLELPDGDRLLIKQSGCEYYVLTFTFETSRFSADTANIIYWGNAALSLMHSVEKGLQTPLDINGALSELANRLKGDETTAAEPLKLEEELDFGGPDPRQYLTLNRISRLARQRYQVELSLSYGPI